jgi:hypothetical protein
MEEDKASEGAAYVDIDHQQKARAPESYETLPCPLPPLSSAKSCHSCIAQAGCSSILPPSSVRMRLLPSKQQLAPQRRLRMATSNPLLPLPSPFRLPPPLQPLLLHLDLQPSLLRRLLPLPLPLRLLRVRERKCALTRLPALCRVREWRTRICRSHVAPVHSGAGKSGTTHTDLTFLCHDFYL